MNRYDDRYSHRDRERDRERERDEWRGSERSQRESFYPGNYGFQEGGSQEGRFQEGEHSARTAGDPGSQPYSQNPYGRYPGQGRGRGEWRGAPSQQYGQREPYNTGGYGSERQYGGSGDYERSRWGGESQSAGGSRYSESQYGGGRGGREQYSGGYERSSSQGDYEPARGNWRQPGGNYGYGAGMDSPLGQERLFGDRPFSDRSSSPGYFGTGNYGDGGSSFTGGFDQHSRPRGYGSLSRDTMRSSGSSGRGSGWGSWEGSGQSQQRYRTGPKGYTRSDDRLREDISERLMMADSIDSSDVTVSVTSCKVTLEGTVPNRHMKHAIEDLVDAAPGVQDIDNRIRVQRSESWSGSSESASEGQRGSSSQTGMSGSMQGGSTSGGSTQSASGTTGSSSTSSGGSSGSTSGNAGKTRKE